MTRLSKRSITVVTALIVAALVTVGVSQWASAASSSTDEVLAQSMAGLAERGVPVKSWSLDGSVLGTVLQSTSTGTVGTPDDPINLSLAQREAFLAKSRGVNLSGLKIEFLNAEGDVLFSGNIVVDRTLDPSWLADKALDETGALGAIRAAITEKVDVSGLDLGPMTLDSKSGAREIHLEAVAADAQSAGASIASLMIGLYNAVNDTNAKNGQIALAFVNIADKTGQPLLKWVYDAQRGTQDWWQAPGMTTDWFETPGPAA
jgi:hypothetical protein